MSSILLIEPDLLLGQTYEAGLSRKGHDVVRVDTVERALMALERHIPDVIILEIQLQTHDGIEFMHELRSYSEWRHIPILINTYIRTQNLAGTTSALKELGVVQVLYKPSTTLTKLVHAVTRSIQS